MTPDSPLPLLRLQHLASAYVLTHIVYSVTGERFTTLRDRSIDVMADDLYGTTGHWPRSGA